MIQQQYHKRAAVLQRGITMITLDRWSQLLRGTSMVMRSKETKHLVYSDDCITFLLSRMDNTGPANLPTPIRIAVLYDAIRAGKTIAEIAAELNVHSLVIEAQMQTIGVKHDQNNCCLDSPD